MQAGLTCIAQLISGGAIQLPSSDPCRYDWRNERLNSALREGTYEKNAVFGSRRHLLPFIGGCCALWRTVRTGARDAGRDHQDGIADLRREELRRGRTI